MYAVLRECPFKWRIKQRDRGLSNREIRLVCMSLCIMYRLDIMIPQFNGASILLVIDVGSNRRYNESRTKNDRR